MVWGALDLIMRTMLALLLGGVLSFSAAAQTEAALLSPERGEPATASLSIRRVVPEVQMVFSAEDHHGRPVLNLGPPQIRVLDNGIAAPLTSFQPAAGLPLHIALLLDASDSMRPGFAAERHAAIAFLRRAQRSSGARTLSLAFAATEMGGNANDPAGALATVHLGGQTALYDALITASGMLQAGAPGRRMVLLLSDGEDNYSRANLDEALATLQHGSVTVYAITVHSSRLEYPGDRVLRQIAAATGGRAFLLPSYRQVEKIFPQIENELCGQYVLGFRPMGSLSEGEFHSVKLIALRKGTVIRSRPGFYVTAGN